jgi:hypothetical protein
VCVVSREPSRIHVTLGVADSGAIGVDPGLVRDHVELVLRRAYPRVQVSVSSRRDRVVTEIVVLGDDASRGHHDTVRKLVEFVVTRAGRLVPAAERVSASSRAPE